MLRIRHLLLFLPLLLTACTAAPAVPHETAPAQHTNSVLPDIQSDRMIAAWIPYFTAERLLADPDPDTCGDAVRRYLQRLSEFGVNTVFVHACAFGESIYPSVYYPQLPDMQNKDGMRIFADICAEQRVALHAWINPFRLQAGDVMEQQTGDAALCAWYGSEALRQTNLAEWDGRYYLRPSAESTGKFLTGVVTELMLRYHPAGIHIDDYFYPTDAPEFDAETSADSGPEDAGDRRRSQITELMQTIYKAVHAADENAVFSVSPQGDLQKDRNTLYADAAAWCETGGCCDLIIPQLYYGYRNEHSPFAAKLREWVMLPRTASVQAAAGIGVYKYGEPDPYAGSGQDEWCTAEKLPAVQTEDVLSEKSLCGVAFYHADALLALPEQEAEALKASLRKAVSPAGSARIRFPPEI